MSGLSKSLKKADMHRQRINARAQQKAGAAAQNIAGGVIDLGLNAGLALVTKSPWAVAATVASAGLLVHSIFGD